jgi:hypothetical protein
MKAMKKKYAPITRVMRLLPFSGIAPQYIVRHRIKM